MKQLVVITIVGTVETDVGMRDLKAFAEDAISTWGGQLHPDDPLFSSVDVAHTSVARVARVQS